MAKTNPQRQSEYRQRHLKEENGHGDRLNIVLHFHAKRALERPAFCYGVTQFAPTDTHQKDQRHLFG